MKDEHNQAGDSVETTSAGQRESVDEGVLREALNAATRIDPADRWVELLAAAILAFATIASAWSAYQATRWSGVQAIAFAEAGALRAESVRVSDLVDTELAIDVELFAVWLDAASRGDDTVTTLLEETFRPEFSAAFQTWLATNPLDNPDSPSSPFEMDEYQIGLAQVADDLRMKAEAATTEGVEANQTGDNYVLTTVLFASVLFFAGISTKFRGRWVKTALLSFGFAAFIAGILLLLTFPAR